ncbi:MAG: four helix bundle protein [Armatimonadetes bacterium CG07_land_8_20_14_0_80_40_9]|nr:MAG: four helix bundle protein [Armatimonadetes bacterium CG07_land_8_20_14_0_80_40_9]
MTEGKKIYNLRDRTFKFAQRILEIVGKLPKRAECEVIRYQLTKSGTSIGANIEEVDGSLTKKDFINKMCIARKEAKETKYWLRLIEGKYMDIDVISSDIREAEEIINILSSIISKSRESR